MENEESKKERRTINGRARERKQSRRNGFEHEREFTVLFQRNDP